ncbi:hypothetical protein HDU91_003733, partial [Kappamyces sp. JEL0680]
ALYSQMTESVKANLSTFKVKRAKKKTHQAKGHRLETTDEDVSDANLTTLDGKQLEWEEDTNSAPGSDDEALIDFRTDLESAPIYQAATSAVDMVGKPLPRPVHPEAEVVELAMPSAQDLNDLFHAELGKASILADFHERYILASLERKRNSELDDPALQTHDATKAWRESIDAHPLIALEDISRSMLAKGISHSGAAFHHGEPAVSRQTTIRELQEGEETVQLSSASKLFTGYLPLDTPRLDVDEELLAMIQNEGQ